MVDTVYIRELVVDTVIGIHDWERQVRQNVCMDLDLAADVAAAAQTDDIAAAVDYQAISKRLTEFIRASEYQLVETLAERCAALVLAEFDIAWLRLRLGKPGALTAARDVGVVIERSAR